MNNNKDLKKILIPVLLGVIVIITAIFAKNITVQKSMSVSECPVGTYSDPEDGDAGVCALCPPGYTTRGPGAESIKECVLISSGCDPGYYILEGTCQVCPANYYCDGTSGTKTACPTNHITSGAASTQSECYITCPAGYYKSNSGSYSCELCPTGTTSQQHNVYYGQTSPVGTCQGSATNINVTCPAGKYLKANTISAAGCDICPLGFYCPGGTFINSSTSDQGKEFCPTGYNGGVTGKKSKGECAIRCLAGTYLTNLGASSCTSCTTGTWSTTHNVLFGQKSPENTCKTFEYECYWCGSNGGTYTWTNTPADNCGKQNDITNQADCNCLNGNCRCYKCGNSNQYYWGSIPSSSDCQERSGITTKSACAALNACTLTYDNNGGNGCTNNTGDCGRQISSLCTPTRSCYRFDGWYTAATGGTKVTQMTVNSNTTLYAHWTYTCSPSNPDPSPTEETYTIKYDKNNENATGTTADSVHTIGVEKALTANGYKLDGNIFNGWNTKADGTGTNYSDKASVTNLSTTNGDTVTLYAKWSPCPAGKYAKAGATSCSSCTGNTYTDVEGQAACLTCPTGQTANSTHTGCVDGDAQVIACPAGTYLKANGTSTSDCVTCPEGFYCPGGEWNTSDEDQGKSPCPEGHIDGGTGLTKEEACKIKCDSGYYKDTATATSCIACPGNKTSDSHLVNYNKISPEDACYSILDTYQCYVCGTSSKTYTWTNKDLSDDSSCSVDTTINSSSKCKAPSGPNPKTGLVRVGGILVALTGAGIAYFAIRKKMISNI